MFLSAIIVVKTDFQDLSFISFKICLFIKLCALYGCQKTGATGLMQALIVEFHAQVIKKKKTMLCVVVKY